jgi:hypothetical protein
MFPTQPAKVMSEFNIFTRQVGDALPFLEQMGYEANDKDDMPRDNDELEISCK